MANSYRELIAWQHALDLSVEVYNLTSLFPREEMYGLTSRMRCAAVSIPSNIAEGYGRNSRSEYRHFLGIARGSTMELTTQLTIAKRLGLAKPEPLERVELLAEEVGKIIWAIRKKLDISHQKNQPSLGPEP